MKQYIFINIYDLEVVLVTEYFPYIKFELENGYTLTGYSGCELDKRKYIKIGEL